MIIAEFEYRGKQIVVHKTDQKYDVFVDGENKQPNKDADGVIRYLANAMHGR